MSGGPWLSGSTFTQVVVISGGAGQGVFVYNGPPVNGNLIASIAAANGTDAFGNAYLLGETSYFNVLGTFFACQNAGAALQFWTAPGVGGPYAFQGFLVLESSGLALVPATNVNLILGGGGGTSQMVASSPLVAATFAGGDIPETWHDLGTSGLAGDAGSASFRFSAENELILSVHKTFNALGAITTATFANVLPAAYIPPAARLNAGEPISLIGAAPGAGTRLTITGGTGAVNLVNLPAGATGAGCDVRIPLT